MSASSMLDDACAPQTDGTIGLSTGHDMRNHLISPIRTVGAGGALALGTVSPVN
jgi:hypothetical protein